MSDIGKAGVAGRFERAISEEEDEEEGEAVAAVATEVAVAGAGKAAALIVEAETSDISLEFSPVFDAAAAAPIVTPPGWRSRFGGGGRPSDRCGNSRLAAEPGPDTTTPAAAEVDGDAGDPTATGNDDAADSK